MKNIILKIDGSILEINNLRTLRQIIYSFCNVCLFFRDNYSIITIERHKNRKKLLCSIFYYCDRFTTF